MQLSLVWVRSFLVIAFLCAAVVVGAYAFERAAIASAAELERDLEAADPAEVDASAEQLERLGADMRAFVEDGRLSGIVTMLARHGKLVFVDVAGKQDIDAGTPMARDSIFRIYSMTKPITGVAMMMLYEEGKWGLDDPASKYIPEFADLKVHVGEDPDGGPILQNAERSMTMRELMSHSGGLAYGLRRHAVDRMYRSADVLDFDVPLQAMIDKLARLPLLAQPGTSWYYSVAVDVQGYLVEQLSGRQLDVFFKERIFDPLGMIDTAFYVPPDKLDRVPVIYTEGDDGTLEKSRERGTRTTPPAGPSGGAGLWGTADDYLRFTQMMLNGGELDGVRLLKPESVELMRTNHLPEEALSAWRSGRGFGLDFAVVMNPSEAGSPLGAGSYYWRGAAGTWFWIDPTTDLTFVGMIQHRGSAVGEVQQLSRRLVYEAVIEP